MKLLKVTSMLAFALVALFSFGAKADTVPVNCGSWTQIAVQEGIYGAAVTYACYDGSALAATRVQCYGAQYVCTCSVTPSAGYTYTGACTSPSIFKVTGVSSSSASSSSKPASCGVNAGKFYGNITVGKGMPFPQAQVNSFCGSCGYTATATGGTAMSQNLAVYCKN